MTYNDAIVSEAREMKAKVELYNGSTLVETFTQSDSIQKLDIEKDCADGKFFGSAITHKLTLCLLDKDRELTITKGQILKAYIGIVVNNTIEYVGYPKCYVDTITRDENTNNLEIVAYDKLYSLGSSDKLIGDYRGVTKPYNIYDFVSQIGITEGFDVYMRYRNILTGYNDLDDKTESGITYSVQGDGSILINGTNSREANTNYYILGNEVGGYLEPGTYTISGISNGSAATYFLRVLTFEQGVQTDLHDIYNGSYTITTDGTQSFTISAVVSGEATIDNVTIYPQLEAGSAPTAYEKANLRAWHLSYLDGANFDEQETLRQCIEYAAEATQSICFFDNDDALHFRTLDQEVKAIIDKNIYFTLSNKDSYRLKRIYNTTELGDNTFAETTGVGETQYIRENPFYNLRDDIGAILNHAIKAVGGLEIDAIELKWRGNPKMRLGDKIRITAKDDSYLYSYILKEKLSYDGGLVSEVNWSFSQSESESDDSINNISEALRQTYAKVDKTNSTIELKTSELSQKVETNTNTISDNYDELNKELNNQNSRLESVESASILTMTPEQITTQITKTIKETNTETVSNTMGTFDENGLTIKKYIGEEVVEGLETQISNNGMTVSQNEQVMLTANADGVDAKNLHATTYLIIGLNSRFEDYDNGTRTGCFWIGG